MKLTLGSLRRYVGAVIAVRRAHMHIPNYPSHDWAKRSRSSLEPCTVSWVSGSLRLRAVRRRVAALPETQTETDRDMDISSPCWAGRDDGRVSINTRVAAHGGTEAAKHTRKRSTSACRHSMRGRRGCFRCHSLAEQLCRAGELCCPPPRARQHRSVDSQTKGAVRAQSVLCIRAAVVAATRYLWRH